MPAAALALERAAAPLDRLRRGLLLGLARSKVAGPLVTRRDQRIRAQALGAVLVASALTCLCPGVLFVVGPALFGVAHLASDLRYLVLRRELPRAWTRTLAAGAVALIALRALEGLFLGRWPFAATEVGLGWTWALVGVGAGLAFAAAPGARRRASVAGPVLLALALAAIARPSLARIVFAHLHNLAAIALWLLLFRGRRRFALPALVLLALAVALCVSGLALPAVRLGGPWAGRFVDEMTQGWPPSVPARTALGLGLAFVLLQAIHYNVWLGFIPQDDLRGEGTLSFRMSLRSLAKDLPPAWLGLAVAAALAVVAASFVDAHRTRQLYLSFSSFHGYLELAAGSFLYVRGR